MSDVPEAYRPLAGTSSLFHNPQFSIAKIEKIIYVQILFNIFYHASQV